jgi:hypothetical protein
MARPEELTMAQFEVYQKLVRAQLLLAIYTRDTRVILDPQDSNYVIVQPCRSDAKQTLIKRTLADDLVADGAVMVVGEEYRPTEPIYALEFTWELGK